MRVAKATPEDIKATREFLQFMENLFEVRSFRKRNGEWEDIFTEDSDEYKYLKRIQKELAAEKRCEPSEIDDRLVLYDAITAMYQRCDLHWNRVLWSADILIYNCCDPDKKYLDWHPFIERAMENGFFGE